jgi:hypothetical protein
MALQQINELHMKYRKYRNKISELVFHNVQVFERFLPIADGRDGQVELAKAKIFQHYFPRRRRPMEAIEDEK